MLNLVCVSFSPVGSSQGSAKSGWNPVWNVPLPSKLQITARSPVAVSSEFSKALFRDRKIKAKRHCLVERILICNLTMNSKLFQVYNSAPLFAIFSTQLNFSRVGGGGVLKKQNKTKTAFSFNMKEVFLSLKFLEHFSSKVHLRLALELYVKYNPCNYLV